MKKILAIVLAVCLFASLGVIGYAEDARFKDLEITKVVFVDGTKEVKAAPFAGITTIKELVFPASVEKIEDGAFADSMIEVVKVVDPDALDWAELFPDAEIITITQAEFEEILDMVMDKATVEEEDFVYDEEDTELLFGGGEEEEEEEAPAAAAGGYAGGGGAAPADDGGKTPSPAEEEVSNATNG